MSERTRGEYIPNAFTTLSTRISMSRVCRVTCTDTIPACRLRFYFRRNTPWVLHLFRMSRTSQTVWLFWHLCLFSSLFHFASDPYHFTRAPLKSRPRLGWPQLPGVNHKHSNYLINSGPPLNSIWWTSVPWLCLLMKHNNSHQLTSGGPSRQKAHKDEEDKDAYRTCSFTWGPHFITSQHALLSNRDNNYKTKGYHTHSCETTHAVCSVEAYLSSIAASNIQ